MNLNINRFGTYDYTVQKENDHNYIGKVVPYTNENKIKYGIPMSEIVIDIPVKEETYIEDAQLKISRNLKLVSLTFDNVDNIYTKKLLDILNRNNSKATFFISGDNISGNEEVIKDIKSHGNEIGINGYSNIPFTSLSIDRVHAEIAGTYDMLRSIDVRPSKIVRPPYGKLNTSIKEYIDAPFVLWNIDASKIEENNIKEKIIDSIEPGSIIKMSDNNIDVLEEVIPELQKQGYEFVTVDEMNREYANTLEPGKVYAKIKNVA